MLSKHPANCARCGDKTARKTLAKFAGLCEPCDLKKGNPHRCPKCGRFILLASERTATRLRGACWGCPCTRLLTDAERRDRGWSVTPGEMLRVQAETAKAIEASR